uniref:Uncharacterized protein n=1 Tax=Anguilla anguilla TaxID=7936 RepID=A0A0E9QBU2_ANGAN
MIGSKSNCCPSVFKSFRTGLQSIFRSLYSLSFQPA